MVLQRATSSTFVQLYDLQWHNGIEGGRQGVLSYSSSAFHPPSILGEGRTLVGCGWSTFLVEEHPPPFAGGCSVRYGMPHANIYMHILFACMLFREAKYSHSISSQ